jgi:hypothetical protein
MLSLRRHFLVLAVLFLPPVFDSVSGAQAAKAAVTSTVLGANPVDRDSAARFRWQEQMRLRGATGRLHAHSNATPHGQSSGAGVIQTIAGSAPFQSPVTALKAGLGQTQGVVEDAHGNLYVSTGELRTVLKIDTTGNVTVYAGKPLPAGSAAASGDGGPAAAAILVSPLGLAIDASGNLFIADSGSYTVREVAAATGIISTVAGTGTFGYSGDGGQATSAELEFPRSLVLDGAGDLFVADAFDLNGYVREINLSTGIISTVAGTNGFATCNLAVGSCPANEVELLLGAGPGGLAYRNGMLYVSVLAGYGLDAGAVVSIALSSGIAQVIAGGGESFYTGNPNAALGNHFSDPNIAIDASGNLDITDDYAVIWQLPAGGTNLNVIAGTVGQYGYSGDGGPAKNAELDALSTITVTPSGEILFADTSRIRQIDTSGNIHTVAGDGTGNYFGDGGPATKAGFDYPAALALDSQGDVFVSDLNDNVIRKVSSQSGIITTIAGNGIAGPYGITTTPSTLPGDGGPATQAALIQVFGLAIDNNSHLYLGSYTQGVRVVDTTTGTISTLNNTLEVLGGMVFDGDHTLYVSANASEVVAVDVTTAASTAIAGGGNLAASSADGGSALLAALSPAGLALDGSGNLYIADGLTSSVRIVNLRSGIIETFAGSASNRTYSGDGGPASAAGFYSVTALSYDGAGHLQIVDSDACVARQVDLSTNIITTVAGNGVLGFTGDGGHATAASLYEPRAIAADAVGNLYVADTGNERIRGIVKPKTQLTGQLTASSTGFPAGESVTFTVSLSGVISSVAPTGAVSFLDGSVSIGTATLTASATAGTYVATLSNNSLIAGTHTITAQYAGDANYAPVTTAAVTLTVTAALPPSFTIDATPTSLSVTQGNTGTTVLAITPQDGFSQAVSFTCGTGLPTGVSCSFSPATVTPTGTSAVRSTLSVTTTGTTSAKLAPAEKPGERWWLPAGGTSLACLLLVSVPGARRRSRTLWLLLVMCSLAISASVVAGCGSGSSGSGSGTNPNATPPGAYTINLSATAGTGATAITVPLKLTLTVTN